MADEKQEKEKREAKGHKAAPAQKGAPPPQRVQARPQRIVRLLDTDIDGAISIERALCRIKGIRFMFAHAACAATGVSGSKPLGDMSAEEIKRVEGFVRKPLLPAWLLNRRKEEQGKDVHRIMADLDLALREDINLMRRIRAYKGIRHELGQPVRGQRTRGSFRKNKAVGVSKKKVQQAAAAAKKEEKK